MYRALLKIDYHNELIEALMKAKAGAVGSNLLAPLLILLIVQESVPMAILLLWMSAEVAVFIARMLLADKVLGRLDTAQKPEIKRLLTYYLGLIFANAFLLGASGIYTLLYAESYILYVIAIIFAVIAGSMSTLTSVFHAVFIFVVTMLSVLIFALVFIGGSEIDYILALGIFFYMPLSLPSNYRIYSDIRKSIEQRDKIKSLNASLKQSVGELKEKNTNFQNLLDITMEAIIIFDEERKIIDTNHAGLLLFEIKRKKDAIGRSIMEFVPPYSVAGIEEAMRHDIMEPHESDLMKEDGTVFPALISSRNCFVGEKKIRIGSIVDLTQIKHKEKQLLNQSRLAQMGEMIAMIAHQWRQPLGAIAAAVATMQVKLQIKSAELQSKAAQEEFSARLMDIQRYIQLLSSTIDDFRNFYKPDKAKVLVSFEEVANKALKIMKSSLQSANIEVITTYHSHEKFELYDNEMMQVMLNIFKNAQDNFEERGVAKPCIRITTHAKSVTICDNGGGVPDAVADKIYDPYFSTKDEINGTGLGLYMSKTIVEEHHNGKLRLTNKEGGACFTIELP